MTTSRITARSIALSAILFAAIALALPLVARAAVGLPKVATGNVTNVRGSSGQLEGTVNPNGGETTYTFQYGPTVAYGSATPAASLAAGITAVRVGQPVNHLMIGFHYRITATNSAGTTLGKDRVFTGSSSTRSKIEIPKEKRVDTYGSPFIISGRITGLNAGGRRLVLQSSPYPYLEPFSTGSAPAVTNSLGAFSFRVLNLFASTQLRVASLDPQPIYSQVLTELVAVRVVVHVRASGHSGLVRVYGTVTPASVGARVLVQLAKSVRPGASEIGTRFATQFSGRVRRATSTFSRFSIIVKPHKTGNYRVEVEPKVGSLTAGLSAHFKMYAAPKATKKG